MASPGGSTLPDYKYPSVIGKNRLRILQLHSAQSRDEAINCNLEEVGANDPVEFEALSWCWGTKGPPRILRIHDAGTAYAFPITENLESAFRALRHGHRQRALWVDAVCINQKNIPERNEQVPEMDKIYGKAQSTCVWLGKGDEQSDMAIDFITNNVLHLWEFDQLCENLQMSNQWAALISLMKRPWFSRRWVVQEIALSSRATIYCGKKEISWHDFADAVALFVEVESATHRLSDVMKRDQKFYQISNFFGHIPSLGAALLVDATGNLFRSSKTGRKVPLSSLEYLVSRLSVFESTQPRDTIYALLAIARDTNPYTSEEFEDGTSASLSRNHVILKIKRYFASYIESQGYNVDYRLPVMDVYQEFIAFSIHRSTDKSRALDIICRPWAPKLDRANDQAGLSNQPSALAGSANGDEGGIEELPSWIPTLNRAAFAMVPHPQDKIGLQMMRQNADPLVGLPAPVQRNYSAAGTKPISKALEFKKRKSCYSMFIEGFVLDEVALLSETAVSGNIPTGWPAFGGWSNVTKTEPPEDFWRTLVADRESNGRNPPKYFPRACKVAIGGMPEVNPLDVQKIIQEGGCTIVAEFLRRVQAVIWNRRLMKTKTGRLALAPKDVSTGSKICILYGCSVPVILERVAMTPDEVKRQKDDDQALTDERMSKAIVKVKRALEKRRAHGKHKESKENGDAAKGTAGHGFQEVLPSDIAGYIFLHVGLTQHGIDSWKAYIWGLFLIACFIMLFLPRRRNVFPSQERQSKYLIRHGISAVTQYSKELATVFLFSHVVLASNMDLKGTAQGIYELHLQMKSRNIVVSDFSINALSITIGIWALMHPRLSLRKVIKVGTRILRGWTKRLKTISRERLDSLLHQPDPNPSARTTPDSPDRFYWKFVGECYLHGMMNGEALEIQLDKRIPNEVFELR